MSTPAALLHLLSLEREQAIEQLARYRYENSSTYIFGKVLGNTDEWASDTFHSSYWDKYRDAATRLLTAIDNGLLHQLTERWGLGTHFDGSYCHCKDEHALCRCPQRTYTLWETRPVAVPET